MPANTPAHEQHDQDEVQATCSKRRNARKGGKGGPNRKNVLAARPLLVRSGAELVVAQLTEGSVEI